MPRLPTPLLLTIIPALLVAPEVGGADVDFGRDVRPILVKHCLACHGPRTHKANLRLDAATLIHKGGESGRAVVAGKPAASLLLARITSKDPDQRMPAEAKPLSPREISVIRAWIVAGAVVPTNETIAAGPEDHWAWKPPRPSARLAEGGNPIDLYFDALHKRQGITPRPPASPQHLLRRVSLDLVGLPPTRKQLHKYLADAAPDAHARTVNRLLESLHHGERWGRHWMDIWRYSEWYGRRKNNEIRYSQRHIWRWRDWIVDSLNADKGYDQMILEMLAGDEIAADDTSILPATGYLGRSWYKFDRNVWLFETVERTGEAFLGLTLRCCRCHDHKFDPISHEEYYRFRAFFEPHNVRTDPVSAVVATETDNGKSQVPTTGLARVYDKDLDVPTYRFNRGDGRYPDESKKLEPGVPAALGGSPLKIEPVELPPAGYYPALRPELVASHIENAQRALAEANAKVQEAQQKAVEIRQTLQRREGLAKEGIGTTDEAEVFLKDDFSKPNPDVWQVLGGDWAYEDGHLIEKAVTSFATIVTKQKHPADFRARVKYRPLKPGGYRSVGFSFDFVDKGNSQDVYTATGDAKQTVQAFHRTGGKQVYPTEGIVPASLKVGELATIEVVVRGSQLTIDLNGERKLDYVMPVERKAGKFALWVHSGSAEFHELEITGVAETLDDLRRQDRDAVHQIHLAEWNARTAKAEAESLQARIAADRHVYFGPDDERRKSRVLKASAAERAVAFVNTQKAVYEIEHQLEETRIARGELAEKPKAETDLEAKLAQAEKKRDAAKASVDSPDGKYKPLGELFPKTSTGRRLALARWITSESNPRTARVAANHLWNRHFGRPLVDTPENFGLNGRQPTHPKLLDWLASELIAGNWQMKPLHRLIVLSSVYRQTSNDRDESNRGIDPENRFLWRMNSRRMEAEVVRDGILHLSGKLDLARGGPDLAESDGEKIPRRSIYFRNTPDSRMPMLELFDMANPNACYRRKESVIPQQALALMNSGLAQDHARDIAANLLQDLGAAENLESEFVTAAFETMLGRQPSEAESTACVKYLAAAAQPAGPNASVVFPGGGSSKRRPAADRATRARENLVHVLLLHNDFVTIR